MFALIGLGSDYNSFVVAATTASHNEALSFTELHSLLLTNESLLQPSLTGSTTSLPTNRPYKPRPKFNPGFRSPSPNTNPNPIFNFPPIFSTRPSYTGLLPTPTPRPNISFTVSPNLGPQTQCQICSKRGHTARDCWYRYDARYNSSTQSQAHTTQTSISAPTVDWYLDSGATHHVTSDLNNLTTFNTYEGHDTLHVGNGTGLKILHIGTSTLNISNRSIILLALYLIQPVTPLLHIQTFPLLPPYPLLPAMLPLY
jgi:hypothetical protein